MTKDFGIYERVQAEERKSILYHLIQHFGKTGADLIVKIKTKPHDGGDRSKIGD